MGDQRSDFYFIQSNSDSEQWTKLIVTSFEHKFTSIFLVSEYNFDYSRRAKKYFVCLNQEMTDVEVNL